MDRTTPKCLSRQRHYLLAWLLRRDGRCMSTIAVLQCCVLDSCRLRTASDPSKGPCQRCPAWTLAQGSLEFKICFQSGHTGAFVTDSKHICCIIHWSPCYLLKAHLLQWTHTYIYICISSIFSGTKGWTQPPKETLGIHLVSESMAASALNHGRYVTHMCQLADSAAYG